MVVVMSIPMLSLVQAVVPCLPKALPGCVSCWLGMLFFKESMIDIAIHHSQRIDIAIVASMAVVIVFDDFLHGLLFGFMFAVLVFLFSYAGSPAHIRAVSDGKYFRSNVTRSVAQHAVLERLGHRIAV